jgi:glycosyltransferase involved in cell wall biosynthesis
MRIAWFTPFHKTSAIGRFSRYVTARLAQFADVDIWHPRGHNLHSTALRTIICPDAVPLDREALAGYDLCVYNLGNHLGFHQRIFETAQRAPGVVVLHDFVMHNFFAGYFLQSRGAPHEYVDAMSRVYGEAGRQLAEAAVTGKAGGVWDTPRVAEFPFFELAARGAYGIVVHSEFFREAVTRVFPGPVKRLFLAYDAQAVDRAPLTRAELKVPPDKLLAVTVGHANVNKRIAHVIEAIGSDPDLARRIVYAVVGPIDPEYAAIVRKAARKHGIAGAVQLVGYASDEVLSSYLAHADICVNLRYPPTEGASASAIEEMLYGKPLIVSDIGFYRDLPADAVFKVSVQGEAEGVRRALAQLAGNPKLRKEAGARARRFATAESDAGRYTEGFLEFANEIMDAAPILQFADRMGDILTTMGVNGRMPLVDAVAGNSHELFCANGREIRPIPD